MSAGALRGKRATSWAGSLAIGERVTITYSVTVNVDAARETLRNVAVALATPPGGKTITPASSVTEHPVLTPLAITGGLVAPWILVLIALLLGSGFALLMLLRRSRVV